MIIIYTHKVASSNTSSPNGGTLTGCDLLIISSTETLGPELIDLLPELRPAPGVVGQCPQAEHDLGALGFPAHAGGAQALLDQTLAGGLGDPGADREVLGEEARIVHLMAMVIEVGPSAVGVVAGLWRARGATREPTRSRSSSVAAMACSTATISFNGSIWISSATHSTDRETMG